MGNEGFPSKEEGLELETTTGKEAQEKDADDPLAEGEKDAPGEDGGGTSTRARYFSTILLSVRILVASLDHVSDFLVLFFLGRQGLFAFLLAGVCIDLLPGPVTAAQFFRRGHPWWRCCLLLFHPINFYLHSALGAWYGSGSEAGKFSAEVALYSREAQGLLEAPMQLIFTLTLTTLRYGMVHMKCAIQMLVSIRFYVAEYCPPLSIRPRRRY